METITLTFGDCAENHRGMQEIGKKALDGLTFDDLLEIQKYFVSKKTECEMVSLVDFLPDDIDGDQAYLLIVRNGCNAIVSSTELNREQLTLERDKKAFMYGRVVNKKARHNLCFSDFEQEPDYEAKKGRIVNFASLPFLSMMRNALPVISKSEKLRNLQCEANYYYDTKKTFIGFHGDTERRIVVAVRLGADFPIHFQWYQNSKPVGKMFSDILKNGDMYFMSEKAVGFDWKRKITPTLRHAAGLLKNVQS